MSRYVSYAAAVIPNSFGTNDQYKQSDPSKKSIEIAQATQAPTFDQTIEEIEATKKITTLNYDGGVSFSLADTFYQSVKMNNTLVADVASRVIIERLSIFGTCDTRVDINASKLTDEACGLFYDICIYNIDLVLKTLREVYDSAPKNSHMVYLVARLTSANMYNSKLTSDQVVLLRTKGYSFVPLWRIPTHFIDWVNTHLSLCSLGSKKIGDSISTKDSVPALKNKKKNGRKNHKLGRSGGTGNGFRNACKAWYMKFCSSSDKAAQLAMHICKKPTHEGTSHKDVLSLIHLEMTSKKKCTCKTKLSCKCLPQESYEYVNLIPLACQIPLAYAVYGLDHAVKILLEGVSRYTHNIQNKNEPENDSEIRAAFNTLAFLCAVTKAKNEKTSSNEVANLIRLFRLTREMVANSQINKHEVLIALTIKKSYQLNELLTARRILLLEKVPLHTLILNIYPSDDDIRVKPETEVEKIIDKKLEICMPITALIRNLNRLTIAGILDRSINPCAPEIVDAISKHITNPDVIQKGFVHPINIFSAWATYSKGKGFKGSQTWNSVPRINTSLLDAVEVAFKGLTGFDATCAFFMDASGSMSYAGSAPGLPNLLALDVAVMLMLTFYRATINFSDTNNQQIPNHVVGYFGEESYNYNTNKKSFEEVKSTMSLTDIQARSKRFVDITEKLPSGDKLTFDIMKALLGNGNHMGCTDIGSALWHIIGMLKKSIDRVQSNDPFYKDLKVFRLPGFVDMILYVTDNDVNSGDQPTDVLALYRGLVRQAFQLIPYDKKGNKCDPDVLFRQYIPRMVVVATSGGNCTIGDPRDPNVLNLSGFDSSGPAIINAFLNKTPNTNNNSLDDLEVD
jgi:hypothetical protein